MHIRHPMGASGLAEIAPLPTEDGTVAACDHRGFARATIDDVSQDAEPVPLADDASARGHGMCAGARSERFFAHGLRPITRPRPDVSALRRALAGRDV